MSSNYGEVSGSPIGSTFPTRRTLYDAKVHRVLQAGIQGNAKEGAESIVISGGYEDDQDYGNEIIYTGEGGRDPSTGQQIADQKLARGNLHLATSTTIGMPVRVIRGATKDNPYAPSSGYRYDGLFLIEDYWSEKGTSGFVVWRYRLTKIEESGIPKPGKPGPRRELQTTLRIIRDTQLTRQVKILHNYACQVCGIVMKTSGGDYAEGAHIKPLGSPHDGPDALDNMLCLCPNHHVLFDRGAFTVLADLSLNGLEGTLRIVSGHSINLDYIAYHHEHYKRQVVEQ